jgi:tripartite-type tricarboxylate transporter receptor subunit TctC
MRMQRRQLLTFGLALLAASAPAFQAALAQEKYPAKPIRLVIPFPPGGIMDTIGRQWADRVGPLLGTIVIDNRGGAGGVVGAGEVARARPDGYTILMGNTSTQVLNPAAMTRPPYDPVKDFATIDMIALSATSMVVHPSLPVRNLKSLIAYARAHPGKLSYGTAGAGTVTHLAGEMFKQRGGGLDILHVPYKGVGLASADLLGGYIPVMTPHVNAQFLSWHHSGKIRILAVNAPARLKAAPDIPVAIEILPDMIAQLFSGVFVPAGTPLAIIERISQASRKTLSDDGFQKVLIDSGSEPVLDSSPAKAQRLLEDERKRLVPLIKAIEYKLD